MNTAYYGANAVLIPARLIWRGIDDPVASSWTTLPQFAHRMLVHDILLQPDLASTHYNLVPNFGYNPALPVQDAELLALGI
jgi:hypothetical protein